MESSRQDTMKGEEIIKDSNGYRFTPSGFQKFMRYWLPALAYIIIILSVSSIQGLPIPPKIPHIDKILHVGEYFFLGLLLGRGFINSLELRGSFAACSMAVALGTLTGVGDEYLQSFIPGRQSSAIDLAADLVGLIAGQIALIKLREMWQRRGATKVSRTV